MPEFQDKNGRGAGLDRTYEELKLGPVSWNQEAFLSLDRTYEELKHRIVTKNFSFFLKFGSYL